MARPLTFAGLGALVRPRIGFLVLVVTTTGYLLERPTDFAPLVSVLAGTLLVASAACALNHYLERDADARMERTRGRPLVTGELSERQVLFGGSAVLAAGLLVLALGAGVLPLLLELLAVLVYLGLYTPLKRRTSTNTWVGALPGALPLLVGSAAAGGPSRLAWIGFLLVFLWQLPHFFAIASLYRAQYLSGGLRVLSGDDPHDEQLRWQVPVGVMSVLLVSLLPVLTADARGAYLVVALAIGAGFLAAAFAFRRRPTPVRARGVVLASVLYLPLLLAALVLDTSCAGGAGEDLTSAAADCCAEDAGGTPDGTTGGRADLPWDAPGRDPPGADPALLDAESAFFSRGPAPADDGTGLSIFGVLPEFELVAEDGRAFGRADLAGELWIVDFLFTRCGTTCPAMSAVYRELLAEDLPTRFLSVTVDPARDGPAELRTYRTQWSGGAAESDWRLLTGGADAIQLLAESGFRLPVNAGTEPVAGMAPMFHSGKLALVDKRSRVRGYYDYGDTLELRRLREDLARLAALPVP